MTATALVLLMVAACQPQETETTPATTTPAAPEPAATPTAGTRITAASSDEEKIAEAMSAAPDSISQHAAVMDWPATEGGEFRQLRAGTNNWVCYPSMPRAVTSDVGQDPMCVDPVFQEWIAAYANRTRPNVRTVGFGYMLRGDVGASNTDPFAMDSTADNNWVRLGPHVMLVAPPATLAALTDTPGPTPWVMWKGTPYAHVMLPVQ